MKNILLISHSLIPSVLLCGHYQLSHLDKQGVVNYKFIQARKINGKDLSWADIIVFVRSESYLEAYASEICKNKKHLVYVMDDDLLNLPDYASSAKYYSIPGIHNNIIKIIQNCDSFLTPSPVLLEKYGNYCKYANLIDEPSLNFVKEKQENNKIKIGFAGSIDRTQDINEILTSVLEEIINKYKDAIEVEFMGAKPEIVNKYNLKYIPYQESYKKYTEVMCELNWDIGLAPMPITPFHECKYFNKYVEYASFGIAGIYTNTKPYLFGIKDKENGLLVNNTKDEWVKAISLLIENNELRNKISKNEINESKYKYSLENLANQYIKELEVNYIDKAKEEIVINFKAKLNILLAMIKDKIIVQKWRFPLWCIKFILIKIGEKLGIIKKKEEQNV